MESPGMCMAHPRWRPLGGSGWAFIALSGSVIGSVLPGKTCAWAHWLPADGSSPEEADNWRQSAETETLSLGVIWVATLCLTASHYTTWNGDRDYFFIFIFWNCKTNKQLNWHQSAVPARRSLMSPWRPRRTWVVYSPTIWMLQFHNIDYILHSESWHHVILVTLKFPNSKPPRVSGFLKISVSEISRID